jgi:hypothetical protein
VQAGSGTATVDVARTGSFAGAVSISVEGAPTGVTVTPSTGTIASGSTSATLAIAVSLNVPAGTYPLTVRGQASGQTDKTAALSLVSSCARRFDACHLDDVAQTPAVSL